MIYQDATNETIELVAASAGAVHWTCSAAKIVAGAGQAVPGTQGVLTTATAVTVSAAPAVGEHQQVGLLTVHNAGAAPNRVTLRKMVGGTAHVLASDLLAAGETLHYTTAQGFSTLRNSAQNTTPPVAVTSPFVSKASLATQLAGQSASLWRAAALPAQGAVPAAAAICTNATLGALPLPVRTGVQKRLLAGLKLACSNVGAALYVEDRLAHMGGLSGVVATAQTVNLDVSLSTNDLPVRIGSPDYSDVAWMMEWYTATGATVVTPSIAVTHGDGTTGVAHIFNAGSQALPASVAASRTYPVIADSGKSIKSIQSVTHPTTGTAGSYGFTAVRRYAVSVAVVANRIEPVAIPITEAHEVSDSACLTLRTLCAATSTGVVVGCVEMLVTA